MTATVHFDISCAAIDSKCQGMVTLPHSSAFRRIIELTGQSPRQNPAFLVLNIGIDDPILPAVLQTIKDETGRIPIPHRIMRRNGENSNYFYVRVFREYDEKDVRDLPYVVVHCSKEIGDLRDPIQTNDEHYLVKANKRLKARWEYGSLGFHPAYAMTTPLKELFEREGMEGFRPRPVQFDKPEKAAKELWQPWSEVMMPRCLLPLVDNLGEPTTPDGLADPIEYTDRPRDPGRGGHVGEEGSLRARHDEERPVAVGAPIEEAGGAAPGERGEDVALAVEVPRRDRLAEEAPGQALDRARAGGAAGEGDVPVGGRRGAVLHVARG